jgi:DNA-binding HxlR family transcriptional regulator
VGSSEFAGYCSYTKAIEHLGDRWCLLVLRQLGTFGAQGFNDLTAGLPGRISRSVLADRLRRLETLGLVSRNDANGAHAYCLTTIGRGLMPTLDSLRTWSNTWLPEDPAMFERDPDVALSWLAQRVNRELLPERPAVLEIRLFHDRHRRYWLVLQRGVEPYGCLRDPLLEQSRYVYLESSIAMFLALAQGRFGWTDALADGSMSAVGGSPELLGLLGAWFQPASQPNA